MGAETGEEIHRLKGPQGTITSVAFSPDGFTLASGSWDGTGWLWDVQTGDLKHTLTGHTSVVNSVAFESNFMLVSGSFDGTLRLWS